MQSKMVLILQFNSIFNTAIAMIKITP